MAVCCSSASFVSLNRRTFSIAITAWSAKVRSRAISRSVNGPTARRATWMPPIPWPSFSIGRIAKHRWPPATAMARLAALSRVFDGHRPC